MSGNINITLFDWVNKHELLVKFKDDITKLFGKDSGKRGLAARNIAKSVWGYHRMLGPVPMFLELENAETGQLFYNNYRDHTAHQVKVFILGLYIYNNVKHIQNMVNKYIHENFSDKISFESENNIFERIWIATSLFHDIGYVIECQVFDTNTNDKYVNNIISEINNRCNYPLSYISGYGVNITKEKRFFKAYNMDITAINDIEKDCYYKELLDAANDAYLLANTNINPFHAYYDTLQKVPINGRKFRDHGIASALLLQHIWQTFITKIKDYASSEDIPDMVGRQHIVKKIKDDLECFDENKLIIKIASSSIALHNITKDGEFAKNCKNINLEDFNISLEKLPITFLLRLVDELQDWDRNYYRSLTNEDKTLDSDDMFMGIYKGRVEVSYAGDDDSLKHPWKGEFKGRYLLTREKLEKYLKQEDLDDILCYKGQFNTEKVDTPLEDNWGLSQIYQKRSETKNNFATENFSYKECDIIAFGLSNLRKYFSKAIEQSLKNGLKLRIITLQPDSLYAKQREVEEDNKGNIRDSIVDLLKWIKSLQKDACGNVELKLYNSLALDFYCRLDDKIYVGPYEPGKESRDIITYEFRRGIGYDYYSENFNRIWEGSVSGIGITDTAYKYYVCEQEEIVKRILMIYCKHMGYEDRLKSVGAVVVKLDKTKECRKTTFFWNKENGSTKFSEHKLKMGAVGFYDNYKKSYLCHFISENKGKYYVPNYDKSILTNIQMIEDDAGKKKGLTDILISPIWNEDKEEIIGILTFEFRKAPIEYDKLDDEIKRMENYQNIKRAKKMKNIEKLVNLCELSDECSELLSMIIIDYQIVDPSKIFHREVINELREEML